MDPIDIRPNGYISQVFALYDSTASVSDYRLGFALSNTFLRVYLDDTIQDIHYLFNATRDYWHYVAVSYTRHFERETKVDVFIDQALVFSKKMFDYHYFDTSNANYQIHIAKNFPGVVRKTKINSLAYVEDHTNTLLINTDSTMCRQ